MEKEKLEKILDLNQFEEAFIEYINEIGGMCIFSSNDDDDDVDDDLYNRALDTDLDLPMVDNFIVEQAQKYDLDTRAVLTMNEVDELYIRYHFIGSLSDFEALCRNEEVNEHGYRKDTSVRGALYLDYIDIQSDEWN